MPSAPKKAATGPGYYDLIKEAVITLKDRTGSSRQAIDKYVSAKKGDNYSRSRLNIALKRGVESGKLVAVKGSFKLAATEKKAPKAKKVALKKKATVSEPKAAAGAAKPKKAVSSKKASPKKKAAKKSTSKKSGATKKKTVKKSAAKKVAPKKTKA